MHHTYLWSTKLFFIWLKVCIVLAFSVLAFSIFADSYLRFPYMRFPSLRNALFRTCLFSTCVFHYLRFQRPQLTYMISQLFNESTAVVNSTHWQRFSWLNEWQTSIVENLEIWLCYRWVDQSMSWLVIELTFCHKADLSMTWHVGDYLLLDALCLTQNKKSTH